LLVHVRLSSFGRRALLVVALLFGLSPLAPAQATAPATTSTTTQAAPRGAEVVAVKQVADRLTDLTVRSQALGGRTVNVRLLTPDGWNPSDRSQHWPTFWLLHGCCGDYTSWSGTDIAKIDSLRKVLVVMPEAGWNGWYSNWWNYGAGGDPAWDTFHTVELSHLLERDWARALTASSPGSRWAAKAHSCTPPGTPACSARPRRTPGRPTRC